MSSLIDLRSDTVTRPTSAMLEAMRAAQVGDDVFGDDPAVNALQRKAADLFGMEAALFCPSGTMSNQIAVKVHTQPGDEVICERFAHLYLHEGGGLAFNSGVSARTLVGDHGRFTAAQVCENLNPDDPHYARTRLVAIENTMSRAGGVCWDRAEIVRIHALCQEKGLALHLDGARLFNALVARGETPKSYSALFDTISVCLSKGLGAPVGSLLLGRAKFIDGARRIRKVLGGGMRQAGYLAAAGLYALDHHVSRLADDHRRARQLEKELRTLSFVAQVLPVETNMVIFDLLPAFTVERFTAHLRESNLLVLPLGRQTVRIVFHLDVDDGQLEVLQKALRSFAGRM